MAQWWEADLAACHIGRMGLFTWLVVMICVVGIANGSKVEWAVGDSCLYDDCEIPFHEDMCMYYGLLNQIRSGWFRQKYLRFSIAVDWQFAER